MSTFVISDMHGCRKTFNKLLNTIGLSKNDKLILLGDVIDRGPDSRGLVTDILKLQDDGYKVIACRGNHEDFLLKAHADRELFECWTYPQNGGDKTLAQYGWSKGSPAMYGSWDGGTFADYMKLIPKEHRDFYTSMMISYSDEKFVLVHAGLDFYKNDPLKETSIRNKLWNRSFTYKAEKLENKILITGHTPTQFPHITWARDIVRLDGVGHITIDAGCPFKNEHGFGHLCALRLDDLELFFEENCK